MKSKYLKLFAILTASVLIYACDKKDEEDDQPYQVVLIDEHFDGTEDYVDNEVLSAYKTDGKLFIEYKEEDPNYFYNYYYYYDLKRNYTIETSMQAVQASEGFQYGVMFLQKNPFNHYYLYIRNDHFFIGYVYNYNYKVICDYTFSEHIKTDGSPNIIRIYKGTRELKFWMNDAKVYECTITNEMGDQIGYRFNRPGKVAIDYLKVVQE